MHQHHIRSISKAPQVAQSNMQIKLVGIMEWSTLLIDIKYTIQFKDVFGPGYVIVDDGNDPAAGTTL